MITMEEFGSDFHFISGFGGDNAFFQHYADARYYASGRQALIALYKQEHWKRIWMPDYFCYEVIDSFLKSGMNIVFYQDNPLIFKDDFSDLDFHDGDALMRVNYFGIKAKRSGKGISVPVVEDHTHNLIGQWALQSDADWCFGSLRKTLPMALGGMLWSPKGLQMPSDAPLTEECSKIASERYEAMRMKADYLKEGGNKESFREKYVRTEELIDTLPISGIDSESYSIIGDFNVKLWTETKAENWHIVSECLENRFQILPYEDKTGVSPFSVVMLLDNQEEREKFRHYLIQNAIYPAILWRVPDDASSVSVDFSNRMLSIHCDARYSRKDIERMSEIINQYD